MCFFEENLVTKVLAQHILCNYL